MMDVLLSHYARLGEVWRERRKSAIARRARPRWEMAFLASSGISAQVSRHTLGTSAMASPAVPATEARAEVLAMTEAEAPAEAGVPATDARAEALAMTAVVAAGF